MKMAYERAGYVAILILAALTLGASSNAKADGPLVTVTNAVPEVCVPVGKALFSTPNYVVPDPAQEVTFDENTNFLTVLQHGFLAPIWSSIGVGDFQRRDPERYHALFEADETFDHTYSVWVTPDNRGLDFYGEGQPRRVYALVHHRSEKLPQIFIIEDDGAAPALAQGLDQLGASDLITYGPRTYPVVRKPGQVLVYEIDTDQPGRQSPAEKKFIPKVICQFTVVLPNAGGNGDTPAGAPVQTQASSPPPSEPTPAPLPSAPTPAAQVTPAVPASDACTLFQASNPGYYAICEDRLLKLQRLNAATGQ